MRSPVFAAQHPGAAVARGGGVGRQAGLVDVGDVGVGVLATNGTPPDAGDHRARLCARLAHSDDAARGRVIAPQATLPLSRTVDLRPGEQERIEDRVHRFAPFVARHLTFAGQDPAVATQHYDETLPPVEEARPAPLTRVSLMPRDATGRPAFNRRRALITIVGSLATAAVLVFLLAGSATSSSTALSGRRRLGARR